MENNAAVIIGGNINGLSIITELKENKVSNIVLIDRVFNYANLCFGLKRKIKTEYLIPNHLKNTLIELKKQFNYLVIFPTSDNEIEVLNTIYDEISSFCFLHFKKDIAVKYADKFLQYEFCEKLNIPYPKTIFVDSESSVKNIPQLQFPIIIKPSLKNAEQENVFRNLILNSESDFDANQAFLQSYIEKGVQFIASEVIPGSGAKIYAYTSYSNKDGIVLNDWLGKKESQFPDDFGVFASATNTAPKIIHQQGRKLVEGMKLTGINEPEFKYDERDGKYKLMEINLRSMMWHRVGNLSGVNIQYSQWLDAHDKPVKRQAQNQDEIINYVYLQYEILNLFCRKAYWKTFKKNLFTKNKLKFAELQSGNAIIFLYSLLLTFLRLIKRCLLKR